RDAALTRREIEIGCDRDLPGRAASDLLEHLAAFGQVLRTGIAMGAQRDETESLVAVRDRPVRRVGARKMDDARGCGMLTQRAGTVVHHLKLVHGVEMSPQHTMRGAL